MFFMGSVARDGNGTAIMKGLPMTIRIVLQCAALLLVCAFPIRAQEVAEPAKAGASLSAGAANEGVDGPENVVGVRDANGKMDYGSPEVEQELANNRMFLIKYVSKDPEYGYTIEKPIMVGNGGDFRMGPANEQRFLNALAGPNGEPVAYKRRGSGHMFKTRHGLFPDGGGLLDIYEVTYPGLKEPIVLYLNMYDSDTLKVPVGFTQLTINN